MKKLITLLLLSLFATVCGQVNADEYEKIFSSENILIDVRNPSEYQKGHLDKAINIPYSKIRSEIEKLAPNKEQTIVVYCLSGKRSKFTAKKLESMGYTNVINAGKYKDLKAREEKNRQNKSR